MCSSLSSDFRCDSPSNFMPAGEVRGKLSSRIRFLMRNSTGSSASASAARSTRPSVTAVAIGWPTARYWQVGVLFCSTTVVLAR